MAGVQAGMEFDTERLPRGPPADSREGPGFFEFNWDATTASAEETAKDVPGRYHELRSARLAYAAAELAKLMGRRPDYYTIPLYGLPANPVPAIDETTFWADLEAARRLHPGALKEMGTDKADFDKRMKTEAQAGAQARAKRMAKGGLAGNLIGGMGGGLTDPINVVTMPIGGGPVGAGIKAAAKAITKNALVNMGIETVEAPLIAIERKVQGRELTGREAAFNIGAAGIGGAVLSGIGIGAGKTFEAALGQIPDEWRMARALREASRGEWRQSPEQAAAMDIAGRAGEVERAPPRPASRYEVLSPDEASALHVIEREVEVDASSPFVPSYEAHAAHAATIDEHLARMSQWPQPTSEAAAVAPLPRTPAAGGVAPQRAVVGGRQVRGGGLNPTVLAGLRSRGFTEAQARGIAAGIHAESRSNPSAFNPDSGAMGIGQWLGPRKRAIIARFGRNPTLEQQLDFLAWELRGGDHGGAAVLAQTREAAVLHAYINDFMRPAKGAETRGDIARGSEALGQPVEAMPEGTPVAPAGIGEAPLIVRPDALDAERPLVTAEGRVLPTGSFAPDEIDVDAGLMQFKSGGDQFGVTERLHGIGRWDQIAAGQVIVWEALDGRRLIADGHQRLGLAKRLQAQGVENIRLNALILRESEGFSAHDARTLTALKNVGEGTGSAIDAAKVFRAIGAEADELKGLPPRSALVRDGKAIARLSDDAYGAVINEVIPANYAAAIGELAPDPESHLALVNLLAEADPPNRRQAEALIRQAQESGFSTEIQTDMFGELTVVKPLMIEKARLLDKVLSELGKMKNVFTTAATHHETLDAAGNVIDVAASMGAVEANKLALVLVNKLALTMGNAVSEIFHRAAQRLAAGEPLARVTKDVIADLRPLDLQGALRDVERVGGADDGGGRGDLFDDEAPGLFEEPRELTPAEQDAAEAEGLNGPTLFDDDAGKLFDDPNGPGVAAAADGLWHDIHATQEAEAAAAKATMSDDDFAALLAETKAKIAAREAQVAELTASGEPVRFGKADGRTALAGPDMSGSRFRLTFLDDQGPSGHMEFNSLEEAVDEALKLGYVPPAPAPPAPHISERVGSVLAASGFVRQGNEFSFRAEGVMPAGQLSSGARVISLRMDESGRYLQRMDGFDVANDVDLRDFADDPNGAVREVLKGSPIADLAIGREAVTEPALFDLPEAADPNVAAIARQETQLLAEQPLRPDVAQESAMPEGLFGGAESPNLIDLGDGKGPQTVEQIKADFDTEEAGLAALESKLAEQLGPENVAGFKEFVDDVDTAGSPPADHVPLTEPEQALFEHVTPEDEQVIAVAFGQGEFNQVAMRRFANEVALAVTAGIDKVTAALRDIIQRVIAGAMSAVMVFNPVPLTRLAEPISMHAVTSAVAREVPAGAHMSPGASLAYSRMAGLAEGKQGLIIVDKPAGQAHFFDKQGGHIASANALTGASLGDELPAYVKSSKTFTLEQIVATPEAERVTPAGKFVTARSEKGDFLWLVGEDGRHHQIAIHTVEAKERLAKLGTGDNTVSFGCVNIDPKMFDRLIRPHIAEFDNNMVFVVPHEQGRLAGMLPAAETRTDIVPDAPPLRAPGERPLPVADDPRRQAAALEAARFDLDDGMGARTIAEIDADLEAQGKAIDTLESCIAPKPAGGAA